MTVTPSLVILRLILISASALMMMIRIRRMRLSILLLNILKLRDLRSASMIHTQMP